MITLKSDREIQLMAEAGALLADIHKGLRDIIEPGITGFDIENYVLKRIEEAGASAEQIGYQGYEYATCVSIDDEICHGFPRNERLKEGQLVKVDSVINLHGGLADSCWSYAVGEVDEEITDLMAVTKEAMYRGIEQAQPGNRIGDIGHAIQSYVEPLGYSVIRDFVGHGLGPTIHEDPMVPHFGLPGKGKRLKPGMIITVEPMIATGAWQSTMDDNGWTARTQDGSLVAQYEHTLAITEDGPVVLTLQEGEDIQERLDNL